MSETPTVIVDFPLRGEWCALNTPAERIPSHGTDYFAQRYAFDFVRLDPVTNRYYPQKIRRHLLGVVATSDFYCWNEPVHSGFAGTVVATGDGWPDRQKLNLVRELLRVTFVPTDVRGSDYRPLTGNYVIVKGEAGVALYGHLVCGSISVSTGQAVSAGEVLGRVGNSGNSTMPHLHFQVMDRPDPMTAAPIHCAFREYDRFDGTTWIKVRDGVPKLLERIRRDAKSVRA